LGVVAKPYKIYHLECMPPCASYRDVIMGQCYREVWGATFPRGSQIVDILNRSKIINYLLGRLSVYF